MKNLTFLILTTYIFIMSSCGNTHEGEDKPSLVSNVLSITDNEDKGVKEILGFYGGYCKYAVGTSASIKEGKEKYFELELSKSEAIEKQRNALQIPASNIAYLFYKNLNEKEQNNYTEIHSVLVLSDGQRKNFEFPTQQLKIVNERMQVVNKVVRLIKEKKFEDLRPLLDGSGVVSYNKDELISNLKMYDPQFGNVTEGFRPFGFRTYTINGKNVLHISGVIIRDKQSNEFSVDLNLDEKNESIYMLQYKF